ncbi:MAG: penicillin-binding transpeptidase domain-containing protein [Chloroflexota bacterium]|nr:penicillin-binding transpeptidase domain-containing protein [Chloroflexota bacterium]
MTIKPTLCLLLIGLFALGACDSILLERNSILTATAPPAVLETSSVDPADVLREFIDGWNDEDYESMYRLIAGRSRELYPRQVFINRYTEAHSVISFAGVTLARSQVTYQGSTAVVDYDIVIESPTFGHIRDRRRAMRLVDEGGWKIAWSQMDIFDGMSARARLEEETSYAQRENIYDRAGLPLAEQGAMVDSLYVVQQDMNNIDDCLNTLAVVTRQQVNTMRNIFAGYLPETLFHIAEIDPERYETYRASLELDCGVTTVSRYRTRRYYGHGIATHIVGYIGRIPAELLDFWQARGRDESALVGRAGIEFSYENILGGEPNRRLQIVERGVTVVRSLGESTGVAPQPVTLTIDRDLQESIAQTLSDAVNYAASNWGGITLGGAIVALDVNSGEVLAMASYPSFDPHIFNPDTQYDVPDRTARLNRDTRSPFTNKAIAEQYTPGSVYKIVTLLAAASEGVLPDPYPYFCDIRWEGQQRFGDAIPVRYDWRLLENRPATGYVDMSQALAASCNPFFWEVGALMFGEDPGLQTTYAEGLGFGTGTGISGLGPEAAGDVAYPNPQEPTEAINNAIGQGNVTVTALQMAQATAMIANGGKRYQPYIVSHTGLPGTEDYRRENQPTLLPSQSLDANALEIIRGGMCQVTTDPEIGTAWWVFDGAPYTVCGKTGTAETAGQPHAWFVAYYPADEPQIAFAGIMTNSREGSEVVAPMIRRILDLREGAVVEPFPGFWLGPFQPLPSQEEALTVYDPET